MLRRRIRVSNCVLGLLALTLVAGSLPAGTISPTVTDQVGLTAVATIALWAVPSSE